MIIILFKKAPESLQLKKLWRMLKEIEILEIQQRLTSKTEITANILVFDFYFFA